MKVSAVTPSELASDPTHPDHDRWVKERTLKMEIDHAKAVGLPLRVAEAENIRLLERAERIARETPAAPVKSKKNVGSEQRKKDRGVTTKVAKPVPLAVRLSPCGRCGTCRRCFREKRILAMSQKARAGDHKFAVVLWNLGMYAQQAKDGTGPFVGIPPRDANRMVIRKLEEICDATVPQMGPWLL